MKTIVVLRSDSPGQLHTNLFEIDSALPLGVGDIFDYRASEPSKNSIDNALYKIEHMSEDKDSWNKFKIKQIQRKIDTAREHYDKWGSGVKLIVESKDVSISRSSDILQDNPTSATIYLYVDIYDESYIRDKKLEVIL